MQQRTVFGGFEQDRITHQNGRNERRVGFVERIIERPHRQHDTEGRPANLTNDALLHPEPRRVTVHFFKHVDGVVNVLHRPVELFGGVGEVFTDFPHNQVNDQFSLLQHLAHKRLHAGNPPSHRHLRPLAPTVVVGRYGRVQRFERFFRTRNGITANELPLQRTVWLRQANR